MADPWESDTIVQPAPATTAAPVTLVPPQGAAAPTPQLAAPLSPDDAAAVQVQRLGLNGSYRDPIAHTFTDPSNAALYRDASTGQVVAVDTGAGSGAPNMDSVSADPKVIGPYLAAHGVNPAWQPPSAAPAPQGGAVGPAAAPGGAQGLQAVQGAPGASGAFGGDPWDADPVVASAGYETALKQDQDRSAAAEALAAKIPGGAGLGQAGDALLNGLTLNNADVVKGSLAAGGDAAKYLLGDHSVSPSDAFAAMYDSTHAQDEAFSKTHPIANLGFEAFGGAPIGEGVGSLVGKGAGLITDAADSVPGWLAKGALGIPANAAVGAAYGAGADKADPVTGALHGGEIGAGLGVAAPIVAPVLGGLINAGRDAGGGIIAATQDALRGREPTLTPFQTASAQATAASYLNGKLTSAGLTPADVAASPLAAKGATVAEAMGPDAVADAASIVRRPGAGAQLARDTLQPRADGRTDRIVGDVASITGVDPQAAQQGIEGVVQAGQDKASPLYASVRADGNRYMTRDFRQVLQTPAGQDALAATHRDLLNGVPGGGPAPEDVGITLDANDQPTVPKGLRPVAIDMLKRNLDDATKFQPFGGATATNANKAVDAARDAWVTSARQVVPGYSDALDAGGDYKAVQGAYKAATGKLFGVGNGNSVQDVSNVWNGLGSEPERDAVRSRFAADIVAKADAGALTPGVLQKPGVYQKLGLAFGQDKADQLVQAAGQEGSLSATGSRMMPNTGSITSDAQAHGGAQDAAIHVLKVGKHM